MKNAHYITRDSLFDMIQDTLSVWQNKENKNRLQYLNLSELSESEDQGRSLLESLCSLREKVFLLGLDLSGNDQWFTAGEDNDNVEMLLAFLESQIDLQDLNLSLNHFDEVASKRIVKTLRQDQREKCLWRINLSEFDWSLEKSYINLAHIIAESTTLEKVIIKNQV